MTSHQDAGQSYGDESPFVRLLDTPGSVRILDAFLRRYTTPISASQLEELAGVNKSTFSRNKNVLLELGLITKAHKEGQTQYYKLNTDSEMVMTLGKFHTELLRHTEQVNEKTQVSTAEYIGKLARTQPDQDDDHERRDTSTDATEAEVTNQIQREMMADG